MIGGLRENGGALIQGLSSKCMWINMRVVRI